MSDWCLIPLDTQRPLSTLCIINQVLLDWFDLAFEQSFFFGLPSAAPMALPSRPALLGLLFQPYFYLHMILIYF